MFVKICGLRCSYDVECVNICKAEYAGFVFAVSRRRVNLDTARKLRGELDCGIKTVGVVVENCDVSGAVDVVQAYSDDFYVNDNVEVWRAYRGAEVVGADFGGYDKILIDSVVPGGGKGFDLRVLDDFSREQPFILAGGLNPFNVGAVLRELREYNVIGVDVSSGVETNGAKDFDKIQRFVNAVKCA